MKNRIILNTQKTEIVMRSYFPEWNSTPPLGKDNVVIYSEYYTEKATIEW